MNIIAVVGNKGGVGKTTLAINLASALNEISPTLLVDADPQGSALQWKDIADEGSSLSVEEGHSGISARLEGSNDHRFCVIDCPPSVRSKQTREALAISNVALIPVLPSPLDLWASVHIEDEVNEAMRVNQHLSPLMVINQMEPRTRLSQRVREVLDQLNLPVAMTAIRRRVAYRNAILRGCSVMDIGKSGAPAVAEIRQLIDEFDFTQER